MRVGIDLGGSHITMGLIDDGKIIQKYEHNFLEEEKENLEEAIQKFLHQETNHLLQKVSLRDIEMVGVSTPR